jgi:hypothetical protein
MLDRRRVKSRREGDKQGDSRLQQQRQMKAED